jgi:hypothetical protein
MRASELIGLPVLDASGQHVGIVTDLRCVQDGPLRGAMAAPRVRVVLVSSRHTGALLGYDRREQQGPWLIRVVIRRLHRQLRIIAWDDLELDGNSLRLRRG